MAEKSKKYKGEYEEESEVEKYLVQQVKAMGGKAYKFLSPGNAGVPDRVVIFPHGQIVFAEVKATHGKTTALQDVQFRRLRDLGHNVWILNSKKLVDCFINSHKSTGAHYKVVMPL